MQTKIPVFTATEAIQRAQKHQYPHKNSYVVFYSSWYGGFVVDPALMTVPVDDHMVHRGDGVFEAIRVVKGKAYLWREHLQRLRESAQAIHMQVPLSDSEFDEIMKQAYGIAIEAKPSLTERELMIRLYVSRGPGGFTVSPKDSCGSQVYMALTEFTPYANSSFENGVNVGISKLSVKPGFQARVKSCNYLPNVLMKDEANRQGWDFAITFDEQGHLAESATENIAIITSDMTLVHPFWDRILKGTTLVRLSQLINQEKILKDARPGHLTVEDLKNAKEVMMIGTTLSVLPVRHIEGVGSYDVNKESVAHKLRSLIEQDFANGFPLRG